MKKFKFAIIVVVFCIFYGCQSEIPPTPTMVAERPTITITPSPTFIPQLQAEPVTTIRPTATQKAEPTITNTSTPTATPVAPTATNFPLPTPINTLIPSATPEPMLPTGNEGWEVPTWVSIGTPLPATGSPIGPDNLNQLVEVGRWGKGLIWQAVYSPDGSRLYVLTQQGIYFYDAATAVQLAFHSHKERANHMALSPDGSILAISVANYPYYHIELRDANNFNFLGAFFPFEQNRRVISKLLFDKSGQYLFIGGYSFSQDGQTTPAIVTV